MATQALGRLPSRAESNAERGALTGMISPQPPMGHIMVASTWAFSENGVMMCDVCLSFPMLLQV